MPLDRSFIKLEQVGKINKNTIDTILKRQLIRQEYSLDSLIIWMNPQIKKEYKGKELELYNIFISDMKNGGEISIVYSKEYGVLMQIYNSFSFLVLDQLIKISENKEVKSRLDFDELKTQLINDTIIFPKVKVPPPLLKE